MRFGVHLAGAGPHASPDRIARLAGHAERLGFDSVWLSDHVVMPLRFRSRYPYGQVGAFTVESARTYYEPLITLAWVACRTSSVRLGISVLVVPQRNPVLSAKQLATLDALSGGRLILGVGVGWLQEEFIALGAPDFARRGAVTNEYLQIFKTLWTQDPATFTGEFYRFQALHCLPHPVQKPHPPIWIGANAENTIRRAARIGADTWLAPPNVKMRSRPIPMNAIAGSLLSGRSLRICARVSGSRIAAMGEVRAALRAADRVDPDDAAPAAKRIAIGHEQVPIGRYGDANGLDEVPTGGERCLGAGPGIDGLCADPIPDDAPLRVIQKDTVVGTLTDAPVRLSVGDVKDRYRAGHAITDPPPDGRIHDVEVPSGDDDLPAP